MLDHLAAILEYPVIIANVPKGLENWTRGEKVEIYHLVGKGCEIKFDFTQKILTVIDWIWKFIL